MPGFAPLSLPFEWESTDVRSLFFPNRRGRLVIAPSGLLIDLAEPAGWSNDRFPSHTEIGWHAVEQCVLGMSLFSARLTLKVRPSEANRLNLPANPLRLGISRAYRDEARAAADRIQREASRAVQLERLTFSKETE